MSDASLDSRGFDDDTSNLMTGDPSPSNGDTDTLLLTPDTHRSKYNRRPGFFRNLLIKIPGIGPWFVPTNDGGSGQSAPEMPVISEAEQQASFKSCAIVAFIVIGACAALFIYLYNSDSDSDWNKP
jgi:hypothetical protein